MTLLGSYGVGPGYGFDCTGDELFLSNCTRERVPVCYFTGVLCPCEFHMNPAKHTTWSTNICTLTENNISIIPKLFSESQTYVVRATTWFLSVNKFLATTSNDTTIQCYLQVSS